jgi:hypothetical protein
VRILKDEIYPKLLIIQKQRNEIEEVGLMRPSYSLSEFRVDSCRARMIKCLWIKRILYSEELENSQGNKFSKISKDPLFDHKNIVRLTAPFYLEAQ